MGHRHFMAVAALAMKHLLVDHVRARRRQKRGGDLQRVTLTEGLAGSAGIDVDALALHDALEELAGLDEQQAQIVGLRYFGGMSISEIASQLGVGTSTVYRQWAIARAWLRNRLRA